MGKFYVYEHWRPDLDVCFYVGKGQHRRAFYFHRKRNTHYMGIVKKLTALGLIIEVRIVRDGMSEKAAYALEKKQIASWLEAGVKLANQSPGGRGGMSGIVRSPETRAKQSATIRSRTTPLPRPEALITYTKSPEGKAFLRTVHLGRTRPPETGQRISAAQKSLWSDPEYREKQIAVMIAGRPDEVTEETIAKMRAAKTTEARAALAEMVRNKWQEPGERERRSAAMSVSNTGRVKSEAAIESDRKAMTPERQAAMQEAVRKMQADPERRQAWLDAMSAARAKRMKTVREQKKGRQK